MWQIHCSHNSKCQDSRPISIDSFSIPWHLFNFFFCTPIDPIALMLMIFFAVCQLFICFVYFHLFCDFRLPMSHFEFTKESIVRNWKSKCVDEFRWWFLFASQNLKQITNYKRNKSGEIIAAMVSSYKICFVAPVTRSDSDCW